MNVLAAIAQTLDIIFPPQENRRRTDPTNDLITGRAQPTPARYDAILASLSGSALFSYSDINVRAAIKALKYDGRKDVVEWFAHKATERLRGEIHEHWLIERAPIVVVPIPLTRLRHIERGFNQSALIARALCNHVQHELEYNDTCLIRSTFSQSQTKTRSKHERAKNIENAFAVKDPSLLVGKTILIVDDIITTGATIREAARVLRAAGVRRVLSFALAH